MRGRHVIRCLRLLPYAACIVAAGSHVVPVRAQEMPAERVAANLNCTSHSANPKELKAYSAELEFSFVSTLLTLDRKTPEGGEEKFRGILSPTGAMLIAGLGKAADGATWSYEFSGNKKQRGVTILNGSLRSEQPKGTRTCSLTFSDKF